MWGFEVIFLPQDTLGPSAQGRWPQVWVRTPWPHKAVPLLSHLKCGGAGPRNTHRSLNQPLHTSGKSTPVILKINYLPPCSLQTFTMLNKAKNVTFPVGMEAMLCSPIASLGHEELLRLGAGDTGFACDPEKVLDPLGDTLPHPPLHSSSSSKRSTAAMQILYLIPTVFQMLTAPNCSWRATDWERVVGEGTARQGHGCMHMHTHGCVHVNTAMSDAFRFLPHTIMVFNKI